MGAHKRLYVVVVIKMGAYIGGVITVEPRLTDTPQQQTPTT